jgi:hypothetical protein
LQRWHTTGGSVGLKVLTWLAGDGGTLRIARSGSTNARERAHVEKSSIAPRRWSAKSGPHTSLDRVWDIIENVDIATDNFRGGLRPRPLEACRTLHYLNLIRK